MNSVYHRLKLYPLFLLLIIVILSSCASVNRNALLKESKVITKDSLETIYISNPSTTYETYTIKPFDQLYIRNLQNAGLIGGENTSTAANVKEANFRVDPDGSVNLPVIGKLQIAGLTRIEGAKKIENAYREKLFNDPIIELQISSLKVTLLGEVSTPGNYILEKEDYDIIDIIGQAGGIKEKGDVTNIRIIRGDRTNPEVIYANLTSLNTLKSPKLRLRNGDIILVQKQRFYEKFEKVQTYGLLIGLAATIINTYIILVSLK